MENKKNLSNLIIEFYEKISSWEQCVVKDTNLSQQQMHVIEIIGHNDNMRMKELAAKMGVTTGTLTVMIDKLESKEMLIRQRHPTDRRSYIIVLTEKGKKYSEEHAKHHSQLTEEITAELNDDEVNQLNYLLNKVLVSF